MARIILKKEENKAKKSSSRQIISKLKYLYSHLYLEESKKVAQIEANLANFGFPIEVSVSPSGCKSYRILAEFAPKMAKNPGKEQLFLPISGNFSDFPLQNEDIFWYLHREWNFLDHTLIKKEDKDEKNGKKSKRGGARKV